jgi:CheY-like chemotaxis protein
MCGRRARGTALAEGTAVSATDTILVVDDDRRVRTVAEAMLRRDGYRVVGVSGPEDALALVATDRTIVLAVIDIVMPVMTGFDLAKELRRIAPSIRIVYMSGFQSDLFQQPVDEPVVAKPFKVDALSEAIAAALRM